MPSKSKSQQRFFGMVDAYKKGELKNPSKKIKKAADNMSMGDVKDFAETKHKGLPDKVDESIVRINESQLHEIIKGTVKRVLSEMDWKTYMNASRKRKEQANAMRDGFKEAFPNSKYAVGRNSFDDMSDELEKHSQRMFNHKHGKDGYPYQWVGSPDYKGRFTRGNTYSDDDFETKAPTKQGWWRGEKADGIRHYRRGEGFPMRNVGRIHDDEYDYAYGNQPDNVYSGDFNAHRTTKIDSNGEEFDPYLSDNSEHMADYQDRDFMNSLNDMSKDMQSYYSGKSKYTKGKGWS